MKLGITIALVVLSCSILVAQDTVYSWKEARERNPEKVVKLYIPDIIVHSRPTPPKFRKYKYIIHLSLSPHSIGSASIRNLDDAGYNPHSTHLPLLKKSNLRILPNWIAEFENLKSLNLKGCDKINYPKQLPKINSLINLEYLCIHPKKLDDELFITLSEFKQLKELDIEYHTDDSGITWANKLRMILPDCKIYIGKSVIQVL